MSEHDSTNGKKQTAQPCGLQPDDDQVLDAAIAPAASSPANNEHERKGVNDRAEHGIQYSKNIIHPLQYGFHWGFY